MIVIMNIMMQGDDRYSFWLFDHIASPFLMGLIRREQAVKQVRRHFAD